MTRYDAIIIGGGHNGLVCAAYLARAGRRVLVLERRALLGGAAVTEELYPGFRYTVCSYVVSLLRPQIVADLNLPAHGFELLPLDGTLTPLADGDYLMRWHSTADTRLELMRHSARDAEAYEQFSMHFYHLAKTVRPLLDMAPPSLTSLAPANLRALLELGRSLQGNRDHLYDLARLMTMSAGEFVEEWFETSALLGTLASSGIIGTSLGPRSPGSAYVMLHHYMGEIDGQFRAWGLPRGGMGSVSEAIATAARLAGAQIRTDAPVTKILVRNGRAEGVVLANGDELHARTIVSAAHPKLTFEQLLDESEVEPEYLAGIRRYKTRGSTGKINLSLDALPEFSCLEPIRRRGDAVEPYLAGALSISPSIDYLEEAYDEAKYGRYSRRPYMDIVIPTVIDPSMAPPGKHTMSIFVQYAPYDLVEGDWDDHREAFADTVIDTLAGYAPNLKDIVLHRQVLTPIDIESRTGMIGGNIFQGELSLDQLFFLRPVPGWGSYRTPVERLFLCGSGTHPGGGVMGAPGMLAARAILAEAR